LGVPDGGSSRSASCTLILISTFILQMYSTEIIYDYEMHGLKLKIVRKIVL
jgi:hypothetical protein